MAPSLVHLPNGQTLTVAPVFGGLVFKVNDLNLHHNVIPPGWTIILNCEDDDNDHIAGHEANSSKGGTSPENEHIPKKTHVHRFRKPSLRNDHIYISSISNTASSEYRPATSATRQIAMMLWATLWWYFHQTPPDNRLTTSASESTPHDGKPKGEWRVNINREGILKGKHLLPKLERMGLIASEDSTVGVDPEDGVSTTAAEGWAKMFVSQRTFWQLDPRIYLFSQAPVHHNFPTLSPSNSRPASPVRNSNPHTLSVGGTESPTIAPLSPQTRSITPPGPYTSNSHLPTFYPPPPLQYTFTGSIRHPIRPKPPRQGETFYTRFIPSLGQYLSFRVASLSRRPAPHQGPVSHTSPEGTLNSAKEILRLSSANAGAGPDPHHLHQHSAPPSPHPPASPALRPASTIAAGGGGGNTGHLSGLDTMSMTDTELLARWMNDPRVAYSWGEEGPLSHQENFLRAGLASRHSFPVIGCFDGRPFGYFEIYWVKEDKLSAQTGCGNWDRGLHALVGEREFRGPHRVKVWLSGLVHYCWLADMRTEAVVMEPRVDNEKLKRYCEEAGFYKEKEVTFPHKQSNLMKVRRESWLAPAL